MNQGKKRLHNGLCFKVEELGKYLRQYANESGLNDEIAMSLIAAKGSELIYGWGWKDMSVCFEPRDNMLKNLMDIKRGSLPYEEVENYIKKHTKENDHVDFYITQSMPEVKIAPYQAKNFGLRISQDHIDEVFIAFLDSLKNKYKMIPPTSLLIHYRNQGTLDFNNVFSWLSSNDFPFREIILIQIDTSREQKNVHLTQIHPSSGKPSRTVFNLDDI